MKRIRMRIIAGLVLAVPTGVHADPQAECSVGASSQVEIGNCLGAAEKTADATVNLALGFAMQAAQDLDDATNRQTSVPALKASQASWSAYRDQHCEFVGTTFGGGSGTGIAIGSCRVALARVRADDLMRYTQ